MFKRYLDKQINRYVTVPDSLSVSPDMVVVIPCYNEPDMLSTINSLYRCVIPEGLSLLILPVINSKEGDSEDILSQNEITLSELQDFSANHIKDNVSIYPLSVENLPKKHAGVGLARKIGMDFAIELFHKRRQDRGVIVSLDADCEVSENYIYRLYDEFFNSLSVSAVVAFKHRVDGDDGLIKDAISQYEKYIIYYRDALKIIGFPFYYHTIGSAFAVTADAYVRCGGMGRQQAGEDFYFLQKVFPLGCVADITDAYVYPMARVSDRVPFGTGPALAKIIADVNNEMPVYSFDAFIDLQQLFFSIEDMYKCSEDEVDFIIDSMPKPIRDYLKAECFRDNIIESKRNSASLATFRKRFYHNFNAFRIIKFLNNSHLKEYSFISCEKACRLLADYVFVHS